MYLSRELRSQARLKLHYKRLAYSVIRDAIGFYFGIPQFLKEAEETWQQAFETKLRSKLDYHQKRTGREVTEAELEAYRAWVRRSMHNRILELTEDYEHCKDVLFNNNTWLELLEIDPRQLELRINLIDQETQDELAVVPTWTTSDYSLGRSYISDKI